MPRLSTSTKRHKPSFLESGKIPTLGQMIRDARGDQQVIRRSTQQALRAWFRQSERLNTARREYIGCADHGSLISRGASASPISPRRTTLSTCSAIACRSSADVRMTPPLRPSADRYTVIPAGKPRWASFTRPSAGVVGAVVAIGSPHPRCGASSMTSFILTMTRVPAQCRKDSMR
jgi:hypothetical protein